LSSSYVVDLVKFSNIFLAKEMQSPFGHVSNTDLAAVVSEQGPKSTGGGSRRRNPSKRLLESQDISSTPNKRVRSRLSQILSPESVTSTASSETHEARVDPLEVVEVTNGNMSVRRVVSSQEMQGKNKAMITFKIYEQHWRRFRKWLSSNGHGRFLIDGKDLFERRQLFASIKLPLSVPIFEDYLTFLVHKPNLELKDYTVPMTFWSTLKYAHDMSRPIIYIPEGISRAWNQYASGYRRVKVQQVVDLGLSVYEGKDSMTRKAFVNLQRLTLTGACTPSQMRWVPQMNAGTRNLIVRVTSIGQLVTSTIRWKNDCLCITLPRHKGDQTGERVIERHVHANVRDPLSCFVFWLGIRILCEPTAGQSHYLFGDDIALYHREGTTHMLCLSKVDRRSTIDRRFTIDRRSLD